MRACLLPPRRLGTVAPEPLTEARRALPTHVDAQLLRRLNGAAAPYKHLAREMATNLLAMARHAPGADVEALDQRSHQILREPPMTEAERARRLNAFQRDQAEIGRLINPYD
jgi:hypothetical protein